MTERSTRAGALAAALLWLGGCASPIPAYERPAPPVAAAFADEAPAGRPARSPTRSTGSATLPTSG